MSRVSTDSKGRRARRQFDVTLSGFYAWFSMSRRGNCYDSAVMESFFSTGKSELCDRFETCGEAKMGLFDSIEVSYKTTKSRRFMRDPTIHRIGADLTWLHFSARTFRGTFR